MNKRIAAPLFLAIAIMMFSGCDDNGASSSATATSANDTSVTEVNENDSFFCELYAYDLYNKYNQYLNDSEAFYHAYFVENAEDMDVDAVIEAAEKCISTFEAIIAIEPPASLVSYHEQVVEGAEYEIKYYDATRKLCLYSLGEEGLTDQEIEDISAFLAEYSEAETNLFVDAYLAAMDAALGVSE